MSMRVLIYLATTHVSQLTFNMAASDLIEMSIDDTYFDAVVNKDIPKAVLAIDNGADVNAVSRHVWAILVRI